jgi:hypothetical protein
VIRTQITLTAEQKRNLARLAAQEKVSMAELIRLSVDQFLQNRKIPNDQEIRSRAIEAAGRLKDGPPDLSSQHDRYLGEVLD